MDREGRLLRCKKLQEFVTMLCDEYTDLCGVTKNFIASFLSLPMTGVTMFVEKYVVKEISPGEFKNFFKIKVSANGGGEVTREARYSELRVLHYRMCILNPQSMGRLLFEFPSKTQSLIESGRQCVRRRRAELNNYVRGVNGLVMSGGMLREWLEFFDCDETGVARGASREDDGVVRRGVNLMEETPPTQVPNTRVPEAPDSAGEFSSPLACVAPCVCGPLRVWRHEHASKRRTMREQTAPPFVECHAPTHCVNNDGAMKRPQRRPCSHRRPFVHTCVWAPFVHRCVLAPFVYTCVWAPFVHSCVCPRVFTPPPPLFTHVCGSHMGCRIVG